MKMRTKARKSTSARILFDEKPYPSVAIPPADPPTLAQAKRRKLVVDFTKTPDDTGAWHVNESNITDFLVANVGEGSVTYVFYVIEYIYAWSPPGPTGLSILDPVYGVEAHDTGSYSTRGRVGIRYPKRCQNVHRGATATGAVLVNGSSGSTEPVYVHAGITYWQSSLNPAS